MLARLEAAIVVEELPAGAFTPRLPNSFEVVKGRDRALLKISGFEDTGPRERGVALVLVDPFDDIYRQESGASALAEVVERLAAARPGDKATVHLDRYRRIKPPWTDWGHLAGRGRHWAERIARVVLEAAP